MGVLEAVSNINDRIAPAMSGILIENQALIDRKLKGKGGRV
jgi:enolase